MRLFVGLSVDDVVRDALTSALRPLWAEGHDVAWTRPSGWHVTLAFVGDTDRSPEDLASAVTPVVADAARPRLSLVPAATWWDRSIVLPVDDAGWCARVGAEIQLGLQEAGVDLVPRAVRPHLTCGRRRGARADPPPFDAAHLDAVVADATGSWSPATVDVFASVTGDGPARYPVVAAVPLAGA